MINTGNFNTFFTLTTDTSSLAPRENRNRYGGFQNKIQNNTLGEPNLTSQNHSLNMAETPLVRSYEPIFEFINYPYTCY